MIYLNTDSPYLLFQDAVSSEFFVDKSMMIDQISRNIRTTNRYMHYAAQAIWQINECTYAWSILYKRKRQRQNI